jgi:CheY-like chemotaxis protein
LEHRAAASEEFPVIAAEASEGHMAASSETGEPAGLSVLLGEDDPVNAMISQAILEKAGHRVRLTNNFARLTEALTEAMPDIVLTDYSMPEGSCDEFISHLREIERSTGGKVLPVIVLTGDSSDDTRRQLLMKGADLVLTKPASPDMIHGAIHSLTTRLVRAA